VQDLKNRCRAAVWEDESRAPLTHFLHTCIIFCHSVSSKEMPGWTGRLPFLPQEQDEPLAGLLRLSLS
jgi:hypothetical protein